MQATSQSSPCLIRRFNPKPIARLTRRGVEPAVRALPPRGSRPREVLGPDCSCPQRHQPTSDMNSVSGAATSSLHKPSLPLPHHAPNTVTTATMWAYGAKPDIDCRKPRADYVAILQSCHLEWARQQMIRCSNGASSGAPKPAARDSSTRNYPTATPETDFSTSRLRITANLALQFFRQRVRPRRRRTELRKVPRPLGNPQKKISAMPFLSFAAQSELL